MKKFKYTRMVIIGLVVIVVVPILLNCILVQQRFCDNIIGNDETWLTFWGSYLGNIIAVVVPFVILWKEIKFNKLEANKERKYQEIVRIKTDLSEKVSAVNFSLIIKSMLDTDIVPQKEIQRLQDLNESFIKLTNIVKMLYGYSRREEEKKFSQGYCKSLERAITISNRLITVLSSMPQNEKLNKENYFRFIECRTCLKQDYDSMVEYFRDNVYPTAINYIQSVEKEYVELCK